MKLSTAVLFISAVSAANAANIRGATTNDRKLQPVRQRPANLRGTRRKLADVITDDSTTVVPTNSTTDGTDVKPTDGGDVTPVIPSDGGDVTPVKPADGGDVTPVKPDDGGDVTPVKPDDGGVEAVLAPATEDAVEDLASLFGGSGSAPSGAVLDQADVETAPTEAAPVDKVDTGGDVPLEPEAPRDPCLYRGVWICDEEDTSASGDEPPVPKVYKEVYEKEINGKKYKVDERPDCIPGHLKSALTSEFSKEMHKKVVIETRKIWTDKSLTAKAREIKVKGKKASIEALEVSIKADMAGAGTAVQAAPIHAASVLCDIADADFAPDTSELTKMVAKKEFMDEQIVANCEDAENLVRSLEDVKVDNLILEPLVKEETEIAAELIAAAVQPDPEVTQF